MTYKNTHDMQNYIIFPVDQAKHLVKKVYKINLQTQCYYNKRLLQIILEHHFHPIYCSVDDGGIIICMKPRTSNSHDGLGTEIDELGKQGQHDVHT